MKLVYSSSLIEHCRGSGRAFHDEIRSQRGSGWAPLGRAKPEPRSGLRRRNRRGEFDASVSSQLLASAVDRTALPSAPTTRSKSRLHSRQANVCRSKWSAWSDAGERRARKVRLPQFAHGGLSCAPKWRAFHKSVVMQVPRPDFKWHEMREMCR